MGSDDTDSDYFRLNLFDGVCIAYIDCPSDSPPTLKPTGTVVLIHGFPQTSYQFRNVVPVLTTAGYRVIAPDYRGAGESSKPMRSFSKAEMAADIVMLLDHLNIDAPVHVVGLDVGGIIAFILASRWPERVASACFGECLLPGTLTYAQKLVEQPGEYFHHSFHAVENLPEALVQGRERLYIEHFINKLCYRIAAFSEADVQRYADWYARPGALRCAFGLHRELSKDAEDTRKWITERGKCKTRCMVISGEYSSYGDYAEQMALEVVEEKNLTSAVVTGAGHFLSEESPKQFGEVVLRFTR